MIAHRYDCQDCNETFTAIDRLVTHRAVVHPQTQLTDDEVFGRFERARWIGEGAE